MFSVLHLKHNVRTAKITKIFSNWKKIRKFKKLIRQTAPPYLPQILADGVETFSYPLEMACRPKKKKMDFFQKIKSIIQNPLWTFWLDFIKQCIREAIINLQRVLNSKSKLKKLLCRPTVRPTSHFGEHFISRFLSKEQCWEH